MADRAIHFIDGNNWYHSPRNTGVVAPGRLDYGAVSRKLLGPRDWIGTRYDIGRVPEPGNPTLYAEHEKPFRSVERINGACSAKFMRILTSTKKYIKMFSMRTTLTIDPDVERLLQREMRGTERSMKAVVNDALRLGLGARSKLPRTPRYKVAPHAFGFKPGIDADRLNQLVDELESDERARQLAR